MIIRPQPHELNSLRARWILAGIVTMAVAVRLVFLKLFPEVGQNELMDSVRYLSVSFNILTDRGFAEYLGGPTAFAPPIYPYFLAGIFKIFGYNMINVKIVQALVGGLTCILYYRMGTILFGRTAGLISAFIGALFPDLVILTGYLYSETVYMLFYSLAFMFLIQASVETDAWRDWILAGVFMGISLLTRHVLLVFPFFLVFVFLLFRSRWLSMRKIVVFVIVCFLTVAPWTIRNYISFKQFIPVAAGMGGPIWLGSNVEDEGEYNYQESIQKVDEEADGLTEGAERDKILLPKALENIRKNPLAYLQIVGKKFVRYFLEIYKAEPDGKARGRDMLVTMVLGATYYPLFGLFLLGVFLNRHLWREYIVIWAVMLYSGLIYAVTVVVPRYRLPLLPFFIFFAAMVLTEMLRNIRGDRSIIRI